MSSSRTPWALLGPHGPFETATGLAPTLRLDVDRAKIAGEKGARRRSCTDPRKEAVMADPRQAYRRVGDVTGVIGGVKVVLREPFRAEAEPSRQAH